MEHHQHRSNPSTSATQLTFTEKWPHFLCHSKVLVQTDTTSAPPSSLVCYKHGTKRREQKRAENRTSSDVSLVTVKLDIEVHAAIPAFSKLREKNYHNLEASLGYAENPSQVKRKTQPQCRFLGGCLREQPVILWAQLPIIFELQNSGQGGVRNTDSPSLQPEIPSAAIGLQDYNMVQLLGRSLVESLSLVMGGGTQSPYQNPQDLGFFCPLRPL